VYTWGRGGGGWTNPIKEPDKRAGGQKARPAAARDREKKQSTQNPRPL